jgi:hypothetical protein
MNNLSKGLHILAHDALGASKKRRQISAFFKKQGFLSLGRDAWLGFRNRDLVSGILVEGSPLDTYVSTFILPAFDRHEFITWALGGRVVHCSPDRDTQEECEQAVDSYVADISKVRSSIGLMTYLDARQVKGHYPIWTRYICYLRLLDFDAATQYLNDSRRDQLHPILIEQLEEVNRFVAMRDIDCVVKVLESWSAFSEKIFGPLDQTFTVY